LSRRLLVVVCVVLAGALVWVAVGSLNAVGGAKKKQPGKQYVNFAAPAFTPVDESTHNNMGESVCVNFQGRQPGDFADENNADLNAITGSYLHSVTLPNKATITDLHLFANDNDGDDNVFAFLVRKQMTANLSPAGSGYEVIAQVNSDGATNNVLRKFSDTTIDSPVVNNRTHYYMLELVNCAVIEPYAVAVGFRQKAKRRR
jgi:hypothetical protein